VIVAPLASVGETKARTGPLLVTHLLLVQVPVEQVPQFNVLPQPSEIEPQVAL
jgi:hypothetical protein